MGNFQKQEMKLQEKFLPDKENKNRKSYRTIKYRKKNCNDKFTGFI